MNYTPEEIADLLKEGPNQPHYIAAMVHKAVLEEREACARACEGLVIPNRIEGAHPDYVDGKRMTVVQCARLIRAR